MSPKKKGKNQALTVPDVAQLQAAALAEAQAALSIDASGAVSEPQEGTPAIATVLTGDWDTDVHQCTSNFQVDGATIWIRIVDGDDVRTYQVSKWRLVRELPEFNQIVRTYNNQSPITLYHDLRDFEDFLWFIHADPVNYLRYTALCPAAERFRRALGAGIIAHFYNMANIRQWAIVELSERINSCAGLDVVPRLHRFAAVCRGGSPAFYKLAHHACHEQIKTTSDPVAALLAAKELADIELQAYAYAHILRNKSDTIASDVRLTTLDRIRLTLGSLNLKSYPCHCFKRDLLPRCNCVKDTYGGRSLWDVFTRSEMGFSLADSTLDLSVPSSFHLSSQADGDVKPSELIPPQLGSNPAESTPCTIM